MSQAYGSRIRMQIDEQNSFVYMRTMTRKIFLWDASFSIGDEQYFDLSYSPEKNQPSSDLLSDMLDVLQMGWIHSD